METDGKTVWLTHIALTAYPMGRFYVIWLRRLMLGGQQKRHLGGRGHVKKRPQDADESAYSPFGRGRSLGNLRAR